MNRLAAITLLLASWVAWAGVGIRSSAPPERNAEPFSLYYISDVHYSIPVGGSVYGTEMFRDMIDVIKADADAAGLIMGGDCPYLELENNTVFTEAVKDSFYALVVDTLKANGKAIFPTIGNHDETWGEHGTGNIFDAFGAEFDNAPRGPFYRPYVSQDDRGRRWYGVRVPYAGKETNVLLFSVNNVANNEADTTDYRYENPLGASFQDEDFDGIKNSTSPQRQDLLGFVQAHRQNGDWVMVTGHRSIHKLSTITDRPEIAGVKADSGYVKALDGEIPTRWLVLQGDTHYNALLDPITTGSGRGHYTLDSAMKPRDTDSALFTALADKIVFANGYRPGSGTVQNADTTYCGGCALEDSIGVTSDSAPTASAPNVGYSILWRLDVRGPEIDVVALYFVYGRATPTEVFSYTLRL